MVLRMMLDDRHDPSFRTTGLCFRLDDYIRLTRAVLVTAVDLGKSTP